MQKSQIVQRRGYLTFERLGISLGQTTSNLQGLDILLFRQVEPSGIGMQDSQIVQRQGYIALESLGIFLVQCSIDSQRFFVQGTHQMVLLVVLQEIGIIQEQFGHFLRGDTVTGYGNSLVINGYYLGNPASLHLILQCLDFQTILLDIRFKGFEGLRFNFAHGVQAGCIGFGIPSNLVQVEYGIGPLVVTGLEKPYRFGEAGRGGCRRESCDEFGRIEQAALHRLAPLL